LEDCFNLNPNAPKSAVFTGWKEMNDYMTLNKIEVVTPTVPQPTPPKKPETKPDEKEGGEHAKVEDHPKEEPPAESTRSRRRAREI
jgi:hypothetical protein